MSFNARWAGHDNILSRLESKLPRTRAKIAFVSQDFNAPPAYFRRRSRQNIGADSLTVMRMSLASFSARLAGHDQFLRRFCTENVAKTRQISTFFGVKAAKLVRKSVHKLGRSSPQRSMRSCMSFNARWAGHEQILSRLESKLPRTRAKIAFRFARFSRPTCVFSTQIAAKHRR